MKKSATPRDNDTKNFNALDPVSGQDAAPEFAALKREIGQGSVVCMASDTFPINRRAWAFPIWAV